MEGFSRGNGRAPQQLPAAEYMASKPDDPRVHATDDSAVIYYVSESEAGAGDSAAGGEIVAYKFSFAACMDLKVLSGHVHRQREHGRRRKRPRAVARSVLPHDVRWERAELGTSYIFVLDGS